MVYGGGHSYKWSIDGSSPQDGSASGTGVSDVVFNSTILDDANGKLHNLTLSGFSGNTSIAQSLVAPGPKTVLTTGSVVQVDHDDPSVVYAGSWKSVDSPSSHTSAESGDSVSFAFCGECIRLDGV